jgi:hypothetical protein
MPLTNEQHEAVSKAIGNGKDWPLATGDPMVNHRIDQLVSDPDLPDWDELSKEEQADYIEEAAQYAAV